MRKDREVVTKIGTRNWAAILLLGLSGQLAWNVENSWFNTFVYDTITPDPKAVAYMVAVSAITATLTTLIMGTVSDRKGKRRPFIFAGYILWGISTVIFPTTAFIKTTTLAVLMVILADGVMTFFGSTAYDAAFNAWTTDISDSTNRGVVSGVIIILPLIATIIGSGLSGILIDSFGYYTFFYTLGALVSLIGIIGSLLLREAPTLHKKEEQAGGGFIKDIIGVFKLDTLRKNKEMFLVLSAIAIYSISVQIFTPYQMIYLNNYLGMSKSLAGIASAVPIIIAMGIAIPAGRLIDRGHGLKLSMLASVLTCIGLAAFSLSRNIYFIMVFAALIYMGYIVVLSATSARFKNLMPEDSRGRFEGVRMIFNVAIPMVIGPTIGSYLITTFGIPTLSNGETGFIPTPILFQVAGVISITTIVPIYIILKAKSKAKIH